MSTIVSKLNRDAEHFFPSRTANLKQIAMNQFFSWGFQAKDQKLVDNVLSEWFTAGTLENILTRWENITPKVIRNELTPLNILCYNVEGWGTRSLEVTDMVYKTKAHIG